MIWLSAPSSSHGQNACGGHGRESPDASSTPARKTSENGKPNRKRMLVAPHVPSFAVNDRCIALRAPWPAAAISVKGIQSVAMENMKGFASKGYRTTVPGALCAVNSDRRACCSWGAHPEHHSRRCFVLCFLFWFCL